MEATIKYASRPVSEPETVFEPAATKKEAPVFYATGMMFEVVSENTQVPEGTILAVFRPGKGYVLSCPDPKITPGLCVITSAPRGMKTGIELKPVKTGKRVTIQV